MARRRYTLGARIFLLSMIVGLIVTLVLFANVAFAENTISSTVTGTTTVDRTPPTATAPSIVINNQDVCTSGTSVAVQTQILGFATGQTITDENCERLKLARSLYGMGMKVAAVSVLCQDERVWQGMWMAGTPCPYLGTIGQEAQAQWEAQGRTLDRDVVGLGDVQPQMSPEEIIEDAERSEGDSKTIGAILGGLAMLLLIF